MKDVRHNLAKDVIDSERGTIEHAIAGIVLQTYDIMKAAQTIAEDIDPNAKFSDVIAVYDRIRHVVDAG